MICFPGLEGCQDFETGEPCQIPDRQIKAIQAAAEKSQRNKARKKELVDKVIFFCYEAIYNKYNYASKRLACQTSSSFASKVNLQSLALFISH